jgi:hypothetical protein
METVRQSKPLTMRTPSVETVMQPSLKMLAAVEVPIHGQEHRTSRLEVPQPSRHISGVSDLDETASLTFQLRADYVASVAS